MQNALSNARHPDETFKNYKARLKLVGRNIKHYLRGQMTHVSSQIVHLPAAGGDTTVDEAVRRGDYRDLKLVTKPDGTVIRVGRTKGVTYRRPQA
jgi:hypothetical protein